jgi:phospholipase C
MAYGEAFLRKVYTALTSNPAKWARTVLVICYDEHGGFFDHVAPPKMHYAPRADSKWLDKTPFDTLGIRVPGIIVSPLVEHQSVFDGLLDHTSILQFMVEKFGTGEDLSYFGDAVNRKKNGVQSLSATLTRITPRRNEWFTMPVPPQPAGPATTPAISDVAQIFRRVIGLAPKLALKL